MKWIKLNGQYINADKIECIYIKNGYINGLNKFVSRLYIKLVSNDEELKVTSCIDDIGKLEKTMDNIIVNINKLDEGEILNLTDI